MGGAEEEEIARSSLDSGGFAVGGAEEKEIGVATEGGALPYLGLLEDDQK